MVYKQTTGRKLSGNSVMTEHVNKVPEQDAQALRAQVAELQAALSLSEQARNCLETQLACAEELSQAGSWQSNPRTGSASWSAGIYRIFGLDPNKLVPRHKAFLEFVHPEDRPLAERVMAEALGCGGKYNLTLRTVRPNGEVRMVRAQGTVILDHQQKPVRTYGVARDITDEEIARKALADSEHRFRLIAETIDDGFWIAAPGMTKMIYASPAYKKIWGRSAEHFERYPQSFLDAVHTDDRASVARALHEHAEGRWHCEYRIVQTDGAVRWVADQGYPVYDENGNLELLTGVVRDITEQRQAQARLQQALQQVRRAKAESERLMLQDPLTGTANRRYLHAYLEREWRREHRDARPIALLLLDIDFFKDYNDFYGHLRGDSCLQRVSACLKRALQRPGDLLARFGGEEFIAVMPGTDTRGARAVAERLRAAIDKLRIPHAASDVASHVTISAGVSCVDPRFTSAQEAVDHADRALYAAKRAGRNRICVAGPGE